MTDTRSLTADLARTLDGRPFDSLMVVLTDELFERSAIVGLDAEPVVVSVHDAATLHFGRRFEVVVVRLSNRHDDETQPRAVLHAAAQHVEPRGCLVVLHESPEIPLSPGMGVDLTFEVVHHVDTRWSATRFRRSGRFSVHDLLFEARCAIVRLTPTDLSERLAAPDPPLVIDTRTPSDRTRFGVIPGAIHIPRTVLEWHLDPANGYLHPAFRCFEQPIVVVCNGGYSSSLAAASLVRLGFGDVSDLIGGHHGWCAAGLPVAEPDHSHLDL